MTTDDTHPVRVSILGFPLDIYRRSAAHYDEVMREFSLIALREQTANGELDRHSVPRRLLELAASLTATYGATTTRTDARRDEAIARGEPTVDLEYEIPREVAPVCRQLKELLHEADAYCREGSELLTLAPDPAITAFVDWYLDEFVAQIEDGAAPTRWPGHAA